MAGCGQQGWNAVIDLVGGNVFIWFTGHTHAHFHAQLRVSPWYWWAAGGASVPFRLSHRCTESRSALTNAFGALCFKGRASVYAKHTTAYQGIRPRRVLSFIGSPVECACVTFPAVCLYPSDSGVCVCVCVFVCVWVFARLCALYNFLCVFAKFMHHCSNLSLMCCSGRAGVSTAMCQICLPPLPLCARERSMPQWIVGDGWEWELTGLRVCACVCVYVSVWLWGCVAGELLSITRID